MKIYVLITAVLLFYLNGISSLVFAAENDDWRYEITPYFFAAGLNGQVGMGGVTADLDMSFGDVWDRFDEGLMLSFEAGKDRWFYSFDGIYFKISDEGATSVSGPFGRVNVDGALNVTTSMFMYQATTGYRVTKGKTKVDVLGALRYTKVDTDANVAITTNPGIVFPGGETRRRQSESWVDAVVGARIVQPIANNWSLLGYADIGTGGSDLTYQLLGTVNWEFAKDWTAKFGYRYIDWDYNDNGFVWDMTASGAYAGLGIKF